MTYPQTLEYLYRQLPMFHRVGAAAYKANLDNTIAICQMLGNPENKFKSIHVAGTNGKGSSSHMLAAVFQQAGYKTGLYTSPHLVDFRERVKINGKPISRKKVISFVKENKNIFEKIKPSFFEWTVGLAFDHFAKEKVDIAVIEVGLGGRLDSTNVIEPLASLITNIGYDHVALLGNSLKKIAAEKAGIIKLQTPVVVSETQQEIKNIFISKAKKNKSSLVFADQLFKHQREYYNPAQNTSTHAYKRQEKKLEIECDLAGTYQKNNIGGVLALLDQVRGEFQLSQKDILTGFKKIKHITGLRGRWEVLNKKPRVICDTGHNTEGIREVLKCVGREYKYGAVKGKLHVVFGAVNDKDLRQIFSLLKKDEHFAGAEYYFCKPAIPRGMETGILKETAAKFKLKGKPYASVKSALRSAKKAAKAHELVFVGGSTFIVAEVV